jgi:hypothetical protein
MSTYEDTDARELDMFNASRVTPVAKPIKAFCGYCGDGLTEEMRTPGPDSHVSKCQAKWEAEQAKLPKRYTDAWLDLAETGRFGRGDQNAARYLRKLDTVERRQRAVFEAHTLGNVVGGRFSGNVHNAVTELLRNIESGTEDQPLYGEKFAHDAREAEKELRRVTGNPNAIHNPFRN